MEIKKKYYKKSRKRVGQSIKDKLNRIEYRKRYLQLLQILVED